MGDSSDKQTKVSFWQGLKAEYKKITWPDRKSAIKQSLVVTIISIILGLIIVALDTAIQLGVDKLVSL